MEKSLKSVHYSSRRLGELEIVSPWNLNSLEKARSQDDPRSLNCKFILGCYAGKLESGEKWVSPTQESEVEFNVW